MSKTSFSTSLRKQVTKRARNLCEYCLLPADYCANSFCLDHILPESKSGKTELENLALCCPSCNGSKYNKTKGFDKFSGKEVPLFNPRTNVWNKHFMWSGDKSKISGITAIGRVTIATLKMNLPNMINLRKALHFYGVFPPK